MMGRYNVPYTVSRNCQSLESEGGISQAYGVLALANVDLWERCKPFYDGEHTIHCVSCEKPIGI